MLTLRSSESKQHNGHDDLVVNSFSHKYVVLVFNNDDTPTYLKSISNGVIVLNKSPSES